MEKPTSMEDESGAEEEETIQPETSKEELPLPRKPISSYFLFMEDHRKDVRGEVGGTAAAVTKVLAERWRSLTAEEKAVYTARSKAIKVEYERALNARGLPKAPGSRKAKKKKAKISQGDLPTLQSAAQEGLRFPVSTVKRVMASDDDHKRATKEAIATVAKASELFVHMLAQKVYTITASGKRSTVRASDIYQAIHEQEALDFLKTALPRPAGMDFASSKSGMSSSSSSSSGSASVPSRKNKQKEKLAVAAKGSRSIQSMFAKPEPAASVDDR